MITDKKKYACPTDGPYEMLCSLSGTNHRYRKKHMELLGVLRNQTEKLKNPMSVCYGDKTHTHTEPEAMICRETQSDSHIDAQPWHWWFYCQKPTGVYNMDTLGVLILFVWETILLKTVFLKTSASSCGFHLIVSNSVCLHWIGKRLKIKFQLPSCHGKAF